jgi:hypothetical protein
MKCEIILTVQLKNGWILRGTHRSIKIQIFFLKCIYIITYPIKIMYKTIKIIKK